MSEINLIRLIIEAMPETPSGSEREFMLGFRPGFGWRAGVWNPSPYAGLGEVDPRFSGEGVSIEEALESLIVTLAGAGYPVDRSPQSE